MEFRSATERLELIKPTIENMMSIGRAMGFSYGIIHRGKVLHTESFGHRYYAKELPVDTKTDSMLRSKSFEPLGLNSTDARGDRDNLEKVSKSYMVLDDGDLVQIPVSKLSGETAFGAAEGVVSCVDDLLQLYQAIFVAY